MSRKEVRSVIELLEYAFHQHKDKILLSEHYGFRTYSLTGKELQQQVEHTRSFLFQCRFRKGDKVLLLGRNSLAWVELYFACILSGIIIIPLDLATSKEMLQRIQRQVKAKALFLDRELASIRASIKIQKYYFDQLATLREKVSMRQVSKARIQSTDILEIQYTSGTTGIPKGVMLTHGNITAAVNAALQGIPLSFRMRFLQLLPLSHIFAQVPGLLMLLYQGHCLFFADQLLPSKIVSLIRNKRIHSLILVPGVLDTLQKFLKGKSVLWQCGLQFRLIGVGGAPLDPALQKWWKRRGIIIVQGYGLTETAAMVAANPLWGGRLGSAGKVVHGVKVRLDTDGEILVRGKNITKGYFQNPEKTRDAFMRGWLRTGDIGEFRYGYLYIRERKKDMIATPGGLKVYPIDIEQILNRQEEIQESCVLEYKGRIHTAIILKKKTASLPALIQRANKQLLPHQKIVSYSIWPGWEFPKTPTGKIKKYLVLEQLEHPEHPEHLLPHMYNQPLYALLSTILKTSRTITPTAKLSDLGMDSLQRIEFLTALEKEYGVEVEEQFIGRRTTVSEVEALLQQKTARPHRFSYWSSCLPARMIQKSGQFLLAYLLIRFFTKTEYEGQENVPDLPAQPVIFACNHQSVWDATVIVQKLNVPVAIAAADEYVFGIGTKKFWWKIYRRGTGLLAQLFFNAYPFGKQLGMQRSLEITGEWLDRGYSILIFPEGERTADGKIHHFKPGAGYLAVQMNVPVVPIKVEGLFTVLPRHKIIPRRGKSKVKAGKPFLVKVSSYLQASRVIEQKVRAL